MAITGECFCGKVRYSLSGALCDARSCHCSRCRKAFSSQASAYALIDPEEFNWTRGESLLTSYVGGHGFGLQFCSVCGSTLCGVFEGIIHGVTLGCINGEPDVVIARHIHAASKAQWEIIPDGVPVFEQGFPE